MSALVPAGSGPLSTPRADAATLLPSGLQTGFQIDGNKGGGSPPTSFDWEDILAPSPPNNDGTFTFTPTGPYETGSGHESSGVVQGTFHWDNGSFAASCVGNDPTAASNQATFNENPWSRAPKNVNSKSDLCSSGYAVETVTVDGERHTILYGYWTRATDNSSVAVYDVFEGPEPGRCDDLLFEVQYAEGTPSFYSWSATSGDCTNVTGPGQWVVVPGSEQPDFAFAMGTRAEGPPASGQLGQTFAEYAIDLTDAGLFEPDSCSTFAVSSMFSRTGNSPTATIQDFLDNTPDPLQISNCGTLTVTKEITPPGTTDDEFEFTVSSDDGAIQPGPPPVEQIVDSVSAGETLRYANVRAGTRTRIEETGLPPPWVNTSIVCTLVDFAGEVQTFELDDEDDRFPILGAGRTDCVLTNNAALVTVTKQTDPDGSTVPFTFDVGGEEVTLSDGESSTIAFPAGEPLTITEEAEEGWLTPPEIACTAPVVVDGPSATITPVLGQNIECTFTNTQLGTIIIHKEAHGDDQLHTFDFTGTFPGAEGGFSMEVPGSGEIIQRVFPDIPPGDYAVSEIDDPDDPMQVADLSCQDQSFPGNEATFTVAPGETVECFFTNALAGQIIVIKRTLPPEFLHEFDFTFDAPDAEPVPFVLNGNSSAPPNGALRSFGDLDPGTYTITEGPEENWELDDPPSVPDDVPAIDCGAGAQWEADIPNGAVTVELDEGDIVTCFFRNRATPAQATVTKTVEGVAPGFAWAFDVSISPAPPAGPPAQQPVSGAGEMDSSVEWTDLIPGVQYTISEAAQPGWDMGPLTCSDQDGELGDLDDEDLTFTFVAEPGQQLGCGMTNTGMPSQVQIAKITTGIGLDFGSWSWDFEIDPVPEGEESQQTVSGTVPGAGPTPIVWGNLVPGQTYTITELGIEGVDASISCTGGPSGPIAPSFQITAPLDGTVTCTATNIPLTVPAAITKTTFGGEGAFDFALTPLGGTEQLPQTVTIETVDSTGTGHFRDDPPVAGITGLVPGQRYSLVESEQAGWEQTVPLTCTVTPLIGDPFAIPDLSDFTVDIGDTVACEATNTLLPGTISFAKSVQGVSEDVAWSFPVTLTHPSGAQETLNVTGTGPGTGTRSWTNLPPGQYTLAEGGLDGWAAGDIVCDDGARGPPTGVQIDLVAGDGVTCEATNIRNTGDIAVQKNVNGVSEDFEWSFDLRLTPAPPAPQQPTATLTGTGPGQSDPFTWRNLPPGTYTLTEVNPGGFASEITCAVQRDASPDTPGFQIQLVAGQSTLCLADNTAEPVSAHITKSAMGGDGTFTFELTELGADPPQAPEVLEITTTDGSGAGAFTNLVPGQRYSLAETVPAGWVQDDFACTVTPTVGPPAEIPDLADFTVDVGDSVACEAHNTLPAPAPGSLSFTKTVAGVPAGFAWSFPVTLTPSAGEPLTQEVSGVGPTAASVDFTDLPPGTYTLAEGGLSGWDAGDISCDTGATGPPTGVAVEIVPGGEVACAATNTATTGQVSVTKSVSGVAAGFDWSFDVGISPAPPAPQDPAATLTGTGPGESDPFTWTELAPGTYTLSEVVPPGWTHALGCGSAPDASPEPGFQVVVGPGASVSCVAENSAGPVAAEITKTALDGDGTFDFTLTALGTGPPPEQETVSITTSGGTGSAALTGLVPGQSYSLVESVPAGWVQDAFTCTVTRAGAERPIDPASFTVVPGDAVECAAQNTLPPEEPGTFSVTKTVTGGAAGSVPTDTEFTIEYSTDGGATFETLVVTAGSPLGSPELPAGTEVVLREAALPEVPGVVWGAPQFTVNGVAVSGDEVAFTIASGTTMAIGVENTAEASPPGTFAVIKSVTGDAAEFVPPGTEFTIEYSIDGGATFETLPVTAGGVVASAEFPAGTEVILREGPLPDDIGIEWGAPQLTVNGQPVTGGQVTFTIDSETTVEVGVVNTAVAAAPGSLAFTKTVAGVPAGFAWSFPVTLTSSTGESVSQEVSGVGPTAASVDFTDLPPGTYTLAEGGLDGWDAGDISCDTDATGPATGVEVAVGVEAAVECEATNTATTGQISVAKSVRGVADGFPWSFAIGIDPAPSGQPVSATLTGTGSSQSEPFTWTGLTPGTTYTVTEPAVAGWTGEITCGGLTDASPDPGFQVVAQPGASFLCVADNSAIPGGGTITKTSDGIAATFEFTLRRLADGTATTVAVTTDETGTGAGVLPALMPGTSYSLAEVDRPEWAEGELACELTPPGGGPPVPITPAEFSIAPGDTVACSADNEPRGRIVIVKQVDGPDASFPFTADGLDPAEFAIETTGGTGMRPFDELEPGTYRVNEVGVDGFELAGVDCTDGDPGGGPSTVVGGTATIELDPAETVTCTYSNAQTPGPGPDPDPDPPPDPDPQPPDLGPQPPGGGGAGPPSDTGAPDVPGLGRLPFSGGEVWPLATAALVLIVIGVRTRQAARRRTEAIEGDTSRP